MGAVCVVAGLLADVITQHALINVYRTERERCGNIETIHLEFSQLTITGEAILIDDKSFSARAIVRSFSVDAVDAILTWITHISACSTLVNVCRQESSQLDVAN